MRYSVRTVLILIACAFVLSAGTPLRAIEGTDDPRYRADGSSLFWFIQISDTHISTWLNLNYAKRMKWAVGEAVDVIGPWFVVNTGDLTDSTMGTSYINGPQLEEWQEYRGYLEEAGMTIDFYFDLPGNHDTYSDGGLTYYLAHSYSGRAYATTQPAWHLRFPHGVYQFYSFATPDNNGPGWPGDKSILTDGELLQVNDLLERSGRVAFRMAFGHHPLDEVDQAAKAKDLMRQSGTEYYACGHKHDFIIWRDDERLVQFRVRSMGQNADNNLGVYAVDNNALSMGIVSASDPWPAAVVTAPTAVRLTSEKDSVSDPRAPGVPNSCADAPLRVLVFDSAWVSSVRARIEGGPWFDLSRRINAPQQWRGRFDARSLTPGPHALDVQATGSKTRTFSSTFNVTAMDSCDIGPEDPDDPLEPGEVIAGPVVVGDGDEETSFESDGDTDMAAEQEPDTIGEAADQINETVDEAVESIGDAADLLAEDRDTTGTDSADAFELQENETVEGSAVTRSVNRGCSAAVTPWWLAPLLLAGALRLLRRRVGSW